MKAPRRIFGAATPLVAVPGCCFPFHRSACPESKGPVGEIAEHPRMANGVTIPHGIRLVQPLPALEPFVRYYGHRDARLGDTVVVHPVHARAAPILDFEFGDADAILYVPRDGNPPLFSPRVVLIGMQTHRRGELHIRGTVDGFAILFQPYALGLLFALPAQEFTNQGLDAEPVFGPVITRFQERLADCRTFEERISVA